MPEEKERYRVSLKGELYFLIKDIPEVNKVYELITQTVEASLFIGHEFALTNEIDLEELIKKHPKLENGIHEAYKILKELKIVHGVDK